MTAAEKLRLLLAEDDRFDAEAYNFIYEALDWTLQHVVTSEDRNNQHVTGQELLEGVRQYAIDQFGCLAGTVLKSWGITATCSVGDMVFNLVSYDLMGKQENDSPADFRDLYDFDEVFDLSPVFAYEPEQEEWSTSYVARSCCAAAGAAGAAKAK